MKKLLQFATAVALMITAVESKAQLADGSVAPDFTLSDINGVSHNLYTYLDAGKTVFIDVSATWCGPCWNYHNTGALEDLWTNHGPSGGAGVIAGTTNDVIVLFIEGDGATGTNALHGISGVDGSTQGDWVTGVNHPIIDPAASAINAFNTSYAIGYFPTIYKICPNRIITEVGQQTATALYATVAACPPPASTANDPAILSYVGDVATCGNVSMKVKLQNNGTAALTSCTITAMNGATQIGQIAWTGNLATYATQDVTIGSATLTATSTLTFNITSSDNNAANNSINQVVNYATTASTNSIVVNITTDRYASETTWKIFNSANTVVGSGGPWTDLSATGTTVQTPVTLNLPNDCYKFEIYDAYGDGINSGYGAGSYSVKCGTTTLASGGTFTTSEAKPFKVNATGIEETEMLNNINVYPNPMSSNAMVSFNIAETNSVKIELVNALGQVVLTNELGKMNAGEHIYSLDATSLNSGFYFLNITVGNNVVTKKVSINK